MGKVVVMNGITLDSVMQSPARPDEDTRGGFAHGGWAIPYSDELTVAKMGERMGEDRAFLFGRRSYEGMLGAWNRRGGPFKDALNNTPKYVASHSSATRLEWPNSTLLHGDVPAAVTELKQTSSANLVIMGSGELIVALMAADLIDEYLLMIAPLVLGTGRRLFPEGVQASLRLTDCITTSNLIATYEPERTQTRLTTLSVEREDHRVILNEVCSRNSERRNTVVDRLLDSVGFDPRELTTSISLSSRKDTLMPPETVRIEPREGGDRLRGYASLAAISRARAGTSMAFVVSTRITVPIPIGTSYSASKFDGRSGITCAGWCFEAYARVFHPAKREFGPSIEQSVPLRWSEIAEARGKKLHPEMHIESLIDNIDAEDQDYWTAISTGEGKWFRRRRVRGWLIPVNGPGAFAPSSGAAQAAALSSPGSPRSSPRSFACTWRTKPGPRDPSNA